MTMTTARHLTLLMALSLGLLTSVNATAHGPQKPIIGDSPLPGPDPFTKEFATFVHQQLDQWKVPGVSIAVIDGDQVYAEGYGFATLPDIPATPETLWYGASTTKSQTAAVLSTLIDSKNFTALSKGWSTPISSIIRDDFVLRNEWATNHLTLEDAVSHRTGMTSHDMSLRRAINGKTVTPKDVVRNLRNLPSTTEPRVRFIYCNTMFVVLSHVIETVTGKWLGDSFKQLLWGPLGMNSTYFDLHEAKNAPNHLASGYYWDHRDEKFHEASFITVTEISGAGGVISNVLDYAKWVKCLLNQSEPLSAAVHADIRTPRMIYSNQVGSGVDITLYALGWTRTLHQGQVVYMHAGGMHAYGAQVYWLPERKFGIVAFANTALSSNAMEEVISWKLIDDKLNIPQADRFDHSAQWKTGFDRQNQNFKNAVDELYPNSPDPPLPSKLTMEELAGTYYDAGYGKITLRVQPHPDPDRAGENILVAYRPESTFKYSMKFEHVSDQYWILYLMTADGGGYLDQILAAKFRVGVDGMVSGLEVEMEGKIMFERVRE
ncbi:hypothetical protein PT974_03462 [Cladobotryum mycophilum]|uniref:Beta-lactamase-related domain-containing protein n=1 Tax=Cladobotryum mycophilum TaxID=491253 RepID=A0ABR0SSI5_9HYPO